MSERVEGAGAAGVGPAELALLWATFIIGRWTEVMASDDEPADDWQEAAADEAVALFRPALNQLLAPVWDEGAAAAFKARLVQGEEAPTNPYLATQPTAAPSAAGGADGGAGRG